MRNTPSASRSSRARAGGVLALLAFLLASPGTVGTQGPRPASLTPLVEQDAVPAGSGVRVAVAVTLAEGLHVQSDRPRDPVLIPTRLSIEAPPGVDLVHLIYPEAIDLVQAGADQPLAVFPREFVVGARLNIGTQVPAGDLVVPGRLRYQACDDRVCYRPVVADVRWVLPIVPARARGAPIHRDVFARLAEGHTAPAVAAEPPGSGPAPDPPPAAAGNEVGTLQRFTVLGTTGGYLGRADFLQFIEDAENGTASRGALEGRAPLTVLLIVFLGGLALNLTPCVLPMIPINLAIIGAGARAGTRRRGFLLGCTYGGAMALVYGLLGFLVILTGGIFGTINSSPAFNAAIAVLFVVLALAMFDVLPIDFSRYSSRVGPTGTRGTFTLAFTMGAVAAILAGACVAPVVIQVVLFSSALYAAGTTVALMLPFLLGIGMAFPWPFAGAGLATLPKPGRWMVHVKHVLGLFILATGVYYGYLAYTLVADRWVDPSRVNASVEEKLRAGWVPSLSEGLALAEREQKPALIDFWATWCKNCLTMDKTTLEDPEVTAALSGYVKIKVQAEDPGAEPVKSLMERFGAIGLPTYVIVRPTAPVP